MYPIISPNAAAPAIMKRMNGRGMTSADNVMKQQLSYRKVKYRVHARNEFDFAMILTACNMKRSLSLRAA